MALSACVVQPKQGSETLLVVGENHDCEVIANVYGEGPKSGPQRALIDWPRKLIEYQRTQTLELFDLEVDPTEQSTSVDASGMGRMVVLLDSLLGTQDPEAELAPVDPVLLEKLKAMGYVH